VVERETEETTDKKQTNFQGSTTLIQPPVTPILEPNVPKTLPNPIPNPKGEMKAITTRVVMLMRDLLFLLILLLKREEYAQKILGFSKNSSGGNPTSTSKPILSDSSPFLTLFERSDFILEQIKAYLKDESISPEIDHADCDPEGDICLIEELLNNDPFQLPLMDLKQRKVVKA
nr:reverse transcriptase domain-containing protein [Tanacetum cinerariifolium]